MLVLTQRTCRLGDKYAGKKDPKRPAVSLKVELVNIALDREELNALLGEPYAYEAIFNTGASPPTPYLPRLDLALRGTWDDAYVALWYDMGSQKVEFTKAKVSKITLEPRHGGETLLSCTVEGEPQLTSRYNEIVQRVGAAIECEIRADRPEDQRDLALNTHGLKEDNSPLAREVRAAVASGRLMRKSGKRKSGKRSRASH